MSRKALLSAVLRFLGTVLLLSFLALVFAVPAMAGSTR